MKENSVQTRTHAGPASTALLDIRDLQRPQTHLFWLVYTTRFIPLRSDFRCSLGPRWLEASCLELERCQYLGLTSSGLVSGWCLLTSKSERCSFCSGVPPPPPTAPEPESVCSCGSQEAQALATGGPPASSHCPLPCPAWELNGESFIQEAAPLSPTNFKEYLFVPVFLFSPF